MLIITDVRMRRVRQKGKLKALASITIDDAFVIHDVRVIEGEKGFFVGMPSKRSADGSYRDIAHPINTETRDRIQDKVLEKYWETLAKDPEPVMETAE